MGHCRPGAAVWADQVSSTERDRSPQECYGQHEALISSETQQDPSCHKEGHAQFSPYLRPLGTDKVVLGIRIETAAWMAAISVSSMETGVRPTPTT